jgi:mannose-6-phosphate isomerase-like protein (cupin superfamily)
MRALSVCVGLSVIAMAGSAMAAAAPAGPPPADKLYTSAAEVAALIANARASAKPDVPTFTQPIARNGAYVANLEYRTGVGPATLHERDAEMFTVLEGGGTLVTGGKLVGETRNGTNLQGKSIEGGTGQKFGKGDFMVVPSGVAHQFVDIQGPLVLMSLYLPDAK